MIRTADDPVHVAAVSPDSADSSDVAPFGEHPSGRFGADVEYRGRVGEHDYVVRARHRLLDTTFTLDIDGIGHDPATEEKARKAREKAAAAEGEGPAEEPAVAGRPDGEDAADDAHAAGLEDAGSPLRFRLEEDFSTLRCTVRRPGEGGALEDAEVIVVRTAGLGGAGEVEIRQGLKTSLLVPTEGSPSALRDEKRTAHPTRYALIAALTKAAKFLIPLLGLGALFSGLLDPVKEWIGDRIRPVIEAADQVIAPIREWIDEVTRPVREFFDALLSPVRELIAAIFRPIGEALRWLLDLLPDLSLPFSVPGWLVDVLVPVVVVLVVFVATYSGLRSRREKLAETADGADSGTPKGAGSGAADSAEAEAADDAEAERGRCGAETSTPSAREVRGDERVADESSAPS